MPKKRMLNVVEYAERLKTIAELHYVDERGTKEIADLYNYKSAGAITPLLKEARKMGIVAFDLDPSFGIVGKEDEKLGQALRNSFHLDRATVVRVDLGTSDSSSRDGSSLKRDDNLHIALANLMGKKIKYRVEEGEHIAVAGGRAVYQVVKVIRRQPPALQNVKITPLSGRIWTHFWQVQGPYISRPLDADDSAFGLALAFEKQRGTSFRQIGVRLFATDKRQAQASIKENCLFLPDGSWPEGDAPHRALVGLGVVDPNSGHRFADLSKDDHPLQNPARYLSGAANELKTTLSLVGKYALPSLGDVVYRLFPALPCPEQLNSRENLHLLRKAYSEVIKAVARLNDKMVVVKWSHLHDIRSVIAIAGGLMKLNVIWTLLIAGHCQPNKRIITELCTDAESATQLLAALKDFQNSPSQVRSWYEMAAREIFDLP